MVENQIILSFMSNGAIMSRKIAVNNSPDNRRLLEVRVSEASKPEYNALLLRLMSNHLNQTPDDESDKSDELAALVKAIAPWPVSDQEDKETDLCAAIHGSSRDLYQRYQVQAQKAGADVASYDVFWNKFRRCYQGSHDYRDYTFAEYGSIQNMVCVVLRRDDSYLAHHIDDQGCFTGEGRDVVLKRFIEEQDSLLGEPHPDDPPFDDWLS